MKVVVRSRYGPAGAEALVSIPVCASSKGVELVIAPLVSDEKLTEKYRSGGYRVASLIDARVELPGYE